MAIVELNEVDEPVAAVLDPILAEELAGYLNEDDGLQLATALEPNSAAAVLLVEHLWAARFADAIRESKGEVILSERIPWAAIERLTAAHAG